MVVHLTEDDRNHLDAAAEEPEEQPMDQDDVVAVHVIHQGGEEEEDNTDGDALSPQKHQARSLNNNNNEDVATVFLIDASDVGAHQQHDENDPQSVEVDEVDRVIFIYLKKKRRPRALPLAILIRKGKPCWLPAPRPQGSWGILLGVACSSVVVQSLFFLPVAAAARQFQRRQGQPTPPYRARLGKMAVFFFFLL